MGTLRAPVSSHSDDGKLLLAQLTNRSRLCNFFDRPSEIIAQEFARVNLSTGLSRKPFNSSIISSISLLNVFVFSSVIVNHATRTHTTLYKHRADHIFDIQTLF